MFENIGFGKFFLKLPPIIDEDGNTRPRIPHNSVVKVLTNGFICLKNLNRIDPNPGCLHFYTQRC